jgi:hypothetical protein
LMIQESEQRNNGAHLRHIGLSCLQKYGPVRIILASYWYRYGDTSSFVGEHL